eukprot:6982960-Prorocentrum_lima.AAC.1
MTSSLVGSEMCIRDSAGDIGCCPAAVVGASPAGAVEGALPPQGPSVPVVQHPPVLHRWISRLRRSALMPA